MTSDPRFSVVTPSFQQADYLSDNLTSVSAQQYSNVEHLVLDGGSDDGTVDLLQDYEVSADHDVWWRSEPDNGQSAAINEGFDRADGDIIGWLNSDDLYIDTTTFSRVVKWFEKTDADVIYGDLAYVDGHSRITEIDVRPEFDRAKLVHRILIGQPATFFRQEVLEDERLDTTLDYCMDYEFWIRLSRQYEFRHVRDILAGFRRHESQKTDDMEPVNDEVDTMLSQYQDDFPTARGLYLSNAMTEARRITAAIIESISIAREPPVLAFDGEIAPLQELLANVGPSTADIRKVIDRVRA